MSAEALAILQILSRALMMVARAIEHYCKSARKGGEK